MFYDQDHLRVERPLTSDGLQLVIDEVTGKPKSKFYHLPLSAKPYLELRNTYLPKNLQQKITVIKGRPPGPSQEETLMKELAAQKAELEALKAQLSKKSKKNDTVTEPEL